MRDRHDLAFSLSSAIQPPRVEMALEPLVVLGASTGGPNALAEVLAHLPTTLEAAIIIVQHVDAAFAPGLGQWLSEQGRRRVTLVVDGQQPAARDTLISCTNDHLIMGEDRRLHYSVEPREVSYRPSVDVFFASLAKNWPRPGVAALMTGMGRDGAVGMLKLRGLKWRTIAQNESSSVVWGMPKAAVEIGAAEEILPLSEIAEAIERLVARETGSIPGVSASAATAAEKL
jgi:two-component system response regulator WspF